MVNVKNLTKDFGTIRAVDNVSFEVSKGTILGFLGPNGAGKSTTMKMVTGFLKPTSGTAVVAGHDVRTDPVAVKTQIGYLAESAPAYQEMTVLEFLDFVSECRGILDKEARENRINEVVGLCNLESVRRQPIETLRS